MPAALHLKPDEVDTPEKRGKYTVSLVGCGVRAIFFALAFAEAGFKVVCTDSNQSVIKQLSKGNMQLGDRQTESMLKSFMRKEQVNATIDLKAAVSGSDIVIITVSPKIDHKKVSDHSETENACKQVGAALQKGSLVVYGGTAGLGFVEGVVKETVENMSGLKAGEDFGLAYNPVLNSSCMQARQIDDGDVTVAADDRYSLNSAGLIFGAITKNGVKKIQDIKMTELAALFAAAKRDANVALDNELAEFCENAGIDYAETIKLLDNNACKIDSAPTISEEDNRNEAYLLLENAENLNIKLRLPTLARQVNEDMVRHAFNLTQEALRSSGKTLRRARVALFGSAYVGTAAATFVELLEAKGAKVNRYDPCSAGVEQPEGRTLLKKTVNEAVETTDCVVILSAQEQLKRLNLKKLRALMKSPAALVDLAGVFEPSKVEKEGFIYRGLGRGAWKK